MNKPPLGRGTDFPDTEPATLPMLPPGEEDAYADTQPMPLASVRPAAPVPLALAPVEATPYDLVALARKDNRVCPQPTRWLEFYRLLEAAAAGAPMPAAPLVGSAWAATPALAKRMCFREQLDWAVERGCVRQAHAYLAALREGDWHVMG